ANSLRGEHAKLEVSAMRQLGCRTGPPRNATFEPAKPRGDEPREEAPSDEHRRAAHAGHRHPTAHLDPKRHGADGERCGGQCHEVAVRFTVRPVTLPDSLGPGCWTACSPRSRSGRSRSETAWSRR